MKEIKNLGHIFIEAFQGINNDGSSKRLLAILTGWTLILMSGTYTVIWAWCVTRSIPTALQTNIGESWMIMVGQLILFIGGCLSLTSFEKTIGSTNNNNTPPSQ